MKRNIGVLGATTTLVGLVVGISIFILPGVLAGSTGPAVLVSYALASLLTMLTCVIYAQIGSVFPVSGASIVSISRLVSPFCGFAGVWMMIGGAAVAISLLAYGFADYAALVFPGLERRTVAIGAVAALAGFNLLGVRSNVLVQGALVSVFMLGLCVFTVAGLVHLDMSLLVPLAPNGWQPVFAAAIPAFFSFAGFMVIIDIGGEIDNPGRTIPRAIALSVVVVVSIYLLVSLALVGTVPWQELAQIDAPVGEAAARILPGWTATAITLSAIAAAASSIHGLMLGYSRDILALAQIQVLPHALSRLSQRTGVPAYSVLFMLALSLAALSAGAGIREFATLIAVALLVLQILLGLAVLALPRRMAKEFRESQFRLPLPLLRSCGVILIVVSSLFLVLAFHDSPRTALTAALYLSIAAAYYALRRRYLRGQGILIENRILRETATEPL